MIVGVLRLSTANTGSSSNTSTGVFSHWVTDQIAEECLSIESDACFYIEAFYMHKAELAVSKMTRWFSSHCLTKLKLDILSLENTLARF